MILDAQLLFSDAQAVTAAAASTNYIDLSVARSIGEGRPLYVVVTVDVVFTDSGSNSTLTVDFDYDSTTTFTPDATQRLFIIPALAAVGSKYFAAIDPVLATAYRYAHLLYTPNNGDLTTGSLTAGIVLDIDKNTSYASGFTVT